MITGTPGHLKAFTYLGFYRYSLTFCTHARSCVFTSEAAVGLVLAQILRAAREERFSILAYCFMPDHVHLLIEGQSDTSDCKRFIRAAKQYAGYHYRQAFSRPLWQRYGFERVLRTDESTLHVANYILENPVRAGLVECIEQCPFSGILPIAEERSG